jgi:hypothetical protein
MEDKDMSIAAMKQALEHLDLIFAKSQALTRARDVLHEAIQQAEEAQPVMWMMRSGHGTHYREVMTPELEALTFAGKPMWTPLYTAPPPRQPLTEEEIDELSRTMVKSNKSVNWLCRAIEAAHGIKGKA